MLSLLSARAPHDRFPTPRSCAWRPESAESVRLTFLSRALSLKASDGSIPAARRVYVFTTALAVLCVFGLFDETGFVALILTSYAAVVARSHWIQLQEAATPAYASVVGEDSPAKPAADKV